MPKAPKVFFKKSPRNAMQTIPEAHLCGYFAGQGDYVDGVDVAYLEGTSVGAVAVLKYST